MVASWYAAPYGNANNQQGGSANALVKNDRSPLILFVRKH